MTESPHLTDEEASRLVAYLPDDEQEVFLHALECEACRDRVLRLLTDPAPAPAAAEPLPPGYTALLDRLEAGFAEEAERTAAEREQEEAAVAALLATPAGDERSQRIAGEARFRTPEVAALLLEKTAARAVAEPEEAERLGVLAMSVIGHLDPLEVPMVGIGELLVRGWALLSRVAWQRGDWEAVRDAIEHAEKVMVTQGYLTKRTGFRRAVASLRQAERQMDEILAAAARSLNLLVSPLLPQVEDYGAAGEGGAAAGEEAQRPRAVPPWNEDETEN